MKVNLQKVSLYRYRENEKKDLYYGEALILKDKQDIRLRVIDRVLGARVKSMEGKSVNVVIDLLQKGDGSAFLNFESISLDGNK